MAGSGGQYTRFVTFSEVMLSPGWEQIDPFRYHHAESAAHSSISNTRSDGKVLFFDVSGDFTVQIIGENVITFQYAHNAHAGQPFQ